jgi:hypothetical protein
MQGDLGRIDKEYAGKCKNIEKMRIFIKIFRNPIAFCFEV